MPNIVYDSIESVPEEFKSIAKDTGDGKVAINVVAKASVDQFRDNNIQLKKDYDAVLAQLGPLKEIVGDDPETFKTLLTEMRATTQRVKDGELKETRAIEEALGKRTDDMRKDFERQLVAKGSEAQSWQKRFNDLDAAYRRDRVSNAIKDAALDPDSDVDPRAVPHLIRLGLEVFSINDDGKLVAMDGDAPIYGVDGTNHMTPAEWLPKQKETNPFFFKTSQGGGAGDGGSNGTKKILGVTPERLSKMTAAEKLALANKGLAEQYARKGK